MACFASWVLTDDVRGFINAHAEILNFDFNVFAGGHRTRAGTRADIEEAQAYVFAVIDAAVQALQTVQFGAGAPPPIVT